MKWPIEFIFTERYRHLAIPCRWVFDLKKNIVTQVIVINFEKINT